MEKKYPIGGYAPGNYQCHCATCGGGFIGDKRSYQCEPCAGVDKAKFDALSPAEQEELIKRNGEAIKKAFEDWGTPSTEWHRSTTVDKIVVSDDAHEKEAMMKGFDRVRKAFEMREWIMEGRGSYPYNDDRYKEEVRYLFDEVEGIIKETWADVKSKSFEYRQQIIAQYLNESPPTGKVWVKDALPKNAGEYYCKCKVDGVEKKLIIEFDKNGQWGEAPGFDYYETFEIIEWLDESKK